MSIASKFAIILSLTIIPLSFASTVDHVKQVIRSKVDSERQKDKIPGIAYAAFTTEGVLFSMGSGSHDVQGVNPVDAHQSLFRLGSVSKLFVVTAIGKLVQSGALSMSTPLLQLDRAPFVQWMMENCPLQAKRLSNITVEHLLGHQGGISKDVPGSNMFWDSSAIEGGSYASFKDFYAGLCDIEFIFEPGQIPAGVKYSNLGFNLLAEIVRGYGNSGSFPQFVREHIFKPLRMRNSKYQVVIEESERLVEGHSVERAPFAKVFDPGSYEGSIGVASSAGDLALLGQELLRWTSGEPSLLGFTNETIEILLKPYSQFLKSMSWSRGIIFLNSKLSDEPDAPSYIWYGHSGTGYGERAILYVIPKLDLGVVVLANTHDAKVDKYFKLIANELAEAKVISEGHLSVETEDLLSQVRAFQESTDVLSSEKPIIKETEIPPRFLEYIGDYYSDVVGIKKVQVSTSDRLVIEGFEMIEVDARKGLFRFPADAGVYFSGEPVKFLRDEAGKVYAYLAAQAKYLYKKRGSCETKLIP